MEIILLMLLSALWGILIVEDILRIPDKLYSQNKIINFFVTMLKCPNCTGAHIFWISYLIIYGSLFGFLLCPIVYFLVFLLKKYLFDGI